MRCLPPNPVFTVDEALVAGWTPSALKHAVRRGQLLRLRRGVYTACPSATPELAAVAAARAIPRAVVSHRSAALLHGLPLLGRPPLRPEITVPPRSNANLPAVHLYRARLWPQDVVTVGDIEVTSVSRTVVDVARHHPLGTAVTALDAALHRELTTLEQVRDVLLRCTNWPGIGRARRAVKLADARAESPLESISRLLLPTLGFPGAGPQKYIFDQHGRLVGRADFYWAEFGVVGEADGRSKYTDRDVLTNEKEHQEEYEDLGLVVVRWGWQHATSRRHVLKVRLERGRARDRAGFPRLWTL